MIFRKEILEDIVEKIGELYDSAQLEKAQKELHRARRTYPDDPTLLEWEATFASDAARYEDALVFLEKALAQDPQRPFALREKTLCLMGLGKFKEALEILHRVGPETSRDAPFHQDRGRCLEWLGRVEEADKAFQKAARADPEFFRKPLRLKEEEFGTVVQDALDEIPERLQPYLQNVIIEVLDFPRSPPLDPDIDPGVLGLYVGIPRTDRTQEVKDHLDRIFIFKRNLEIEFPLRARLREEIRKTVIHEIAHHFGFGEGDMGDYE